ncbi:hypothetical protein [Stenotrophomonas maltophilia]|uniref:hypothetical protein n=1 Tax=Stenotrophomonas maltophilia TaxID=40324 RepID=UPI000C15CEE1|nr:hypothetical protein [Stenotrophomonas maltophilia]
MSNDKTTLADVQPGGRVRLGDSLPPLPEPSVTGYGFDSVLRRIPMPGFTAEQMRDYALAALSAQPSPGGQGDAPLRVFSAGRWTYDGTGQSFSHEDMDSAAFVVYRDDSLAARQPVGEPVCSGGFVIANGSGEKYMAWGQVGPEWTADRSAALWLVRRADAEALAAENEDAWSILPVERCALPPNGWACTLAAGHEGPCPTIAAPTAQAVDLGQSIPSELAPVAAALKRFGDCAEDSGSEGCDIGRDWFDALTTIGLLSRTQRSPAVWTMTAEGERLLALIDSQAVGNG